jgi:hypothetical protein
MDAATLAALSEAPADFSVHQVEDTYYVLDSQRNVLAKLNDAHAVSAGALAGWVAATILNASSTGYLREHEYDVAVHVITEYL